MKAGLVDVVVLVIGDTSVILCCDVEMRRKSQQPVESHADI